MPTMQPTGVESRVGDLARFYQALEDAGAAGTGDGAGGGRGPPPGVPVRGRRPAALPVLRGRHAGTEAQPLRPVRRLRRIPRLRLPRPQRLVRVAGRRRRGREAGTDVAARRHGARSGRPRSCAALAGAAARGRRASRGLRDRGIAGSLAWNPRPSGRGPKLTLTQSIGAGASGGKDALLSRTTLEGLAANDNGDGQRRLEARFGYGFGMFGGQLTGTPEIGLGLSEAGRDYSLGWRLTRAGSGAVSLEFSVAPG